MFGAIAAICGALLLAAAWRSRVEKMVFRFLRWSGVSTVRRLGSAWAPMASRPDLKPTILLVTKKDGSQVMSENMSQFEGLPNGFCILGRDGSIAMYATHVRRSIAEEWSEVSSGPYEDWGAEVTVISADQIAEVAIRGF